MSGDRPPSVWHAYLDGFHERHPGITEDVLVRSVAAGSRMTPYAWLLDGEPRPAGAPAPRSTGPARRAGPALDLACGSAPLAHGADPGRFVGVDRSPGELARAARSTGTSLVRADAGVLPFADGAFALVACSMALMLFDPVDAALDEIRRVLRPDGVAMFLLPGSVPLTLRDRARYARLLAALHLVKPSYANTVHLARLRGRLARAGLRVLADERRRFAYRVSDAGAARRFAESLYSPGAVPGRVEGAARVTGRWVGTEIGIPLRRVVCAASARPLDRAVGESPRI